MKRNEINVGYDYAVVIAGHSSIEKIGRYCTMLKGRVLEKGVPVLYNDQYRRIGFKVEVRRFTSDGKEIFSTHTLVAINFRSRWEDEVRRRPEHYAEIERIAEFNRDKAERRDTVALRTAAIVTAIDPTGIRADREDVTISLDDFMLILDDLEAKDRLLDYFYSQQA